MHTTTRQTLTALAVACVMALVAESTKAGTVTAGDTGIGNTTNQVQTGPLPIHGSATVTFSAPNPDQWLTTKTAQGVTGIGIFSKGDKEREIEFGEVLRATFSQGLVLTGLRLGLLFDGPEFHDVMEKAIVTATFVGGGTQSFSFQARYNWDNPGMPTAQLWGAHGGASWANVQAPVIGSGGVWDVFNPFGTSLVTQLDFTAPSLHEWHCGIGRCTNPSDFVVMSVTAVPEPATLALMAAGLGVVGWAARRRKAQGGEQRLAAA